LLLCRRGFRNPNGDSRDAFAAGGLDVVFVVPDGSDGPRGYWPAAEGLTTLVATTASSYFRQQTGIEPAVEEDAMTIALDMMNAGVTGVGEHETLT
jgi:hypothetical protein